MSRIEEIQKQIEELEKKTQELQKELEIEKQKNEIEYPFEDNEEYWLVTTKGTIRADEWSNNIIDIKYYYKQGNIFKTKVEAEKEADRRELLMLFKQYRDKCNGGWKPNFADYLQDKYSFYYDYHAQKFDYCDLGEEDGFNLFGYFRNHLDCERAIELFGKEIKRLFVEEEND